MADGIVQLAPDSTGKKVDTSEITVGANTVERQRIALADGTTAAGIAVVTNAIPSGASQYGLVVRPYPFSDGTSQVAIKAASTAAVAADPALVVAVSPNNNVTIQGVQDTRVTGTITTAASTVSASSAQRNVGTVTISGTYAGVTFVIEGSDDGSTFYPIQAINNSTGQAGSTWTPGTNAAASYDFAIGGWVNIRVRATAWTSGTANIGIIQQAFAYDPGVGAICQGIVAAGVAPVGNPVYMAGTDGSLLRGFLLDTSGRAIVAGAAASGAAIAGSPVLMGGTFTTTLPTVTTGQAVNIQTTARGEQLVAISSGAVAVAVKAASTAAAAADPALVVAISPNNVVIAASPAMLIPTTNVTRPANVTAYSANTCLSDSTSAPTAGGFTLTSAVRASGKTGLLTDMIITSSAPTGGLQGEIWLFDSAVTNVNDGSAFAISDAEVKTLLGVVPFILTADTNNAWAMVTGLNIGIVPVGSANIRYLIKVKAAYTPQSGEVITVRAKVLPID